MALGLIATAFVLAASGSVLALSAQRAVAAGALAKPPIGCLHGRDAPLRFGDLRIADRLLPRAIALHYQDKGDGSSSWHAQQLAAMIGFKLAFTAEERSELARKVGAEVADCPRR
ncbi:MAG TPA: hypothetical protein VI168_11535 [Croceibacterium sp.]